MLEREVRYEATDEARGKGPRIGAAVVAGMIGFSVAVAALITFVLAPDDAPPPAALHVEPAPGGRFAPLLTTELRGERLGAEAYWEELATTWGWRDAEHRVARIPVARARALWLASQAAATPPPAPGGEGSP